MIECRTKGIPMREGVHIDDEGYHTFSLDPSKHDPFTIVERLMAACGAPADTPESATRWKAMQRERAERERLEREQARRR